MTISSTGTRFSYSGNGSTTAFSFPRQFFADADLDVYLVDNTTGVATLQVLSTNYTVTGAGSPSGGTVTMLVAPATGKTLVLVRDTAATQGLDLDAVTSMPMTSLEAALDRAMMVIDELATKLGRAIMYPIEGISSMNWSLPNPPVASTVLGINSTGTALELRSPQIWSNGTGAPSGASGSIGDYYLDNATGDVYKKTGSSTWTLQTNIRGLTGATGSTGGIGPTGTAGSGWRSGAGVPAGGLGVVTDWYLNTSNGDVYEKTGASTWTLQGNLKGPTGATGSNGTNGTNGTNGAPGSVWYSGSGAPSSGLGINGDYYLDTASSFVYGKSGGSWTYLMTIAGGGGGGSGDVVGPAGATNNNLAAFNGTTGKSILDSGVSISSLLLTSGIGSTVQAWDADLDAIAALAGTSGLLKKTAANTWTLDTTAYLSGTVPIANGGTGQTNATAAANALDGWQEIVSSASAVTLTNTSPRLIYVSGSVAQTIILPDVTTLQFGWVFTIFNGSSQSITVQSSGGNLIGSIVPPGLRSKFYCILLTGTTNASWVQQYSGSSTRTGSGSLVHASSPTLASPIITFSTSAAVTAGTNAQGQGALTSDLNVITTAANNPSGVTLPTATVGRRIIVVNKGANPIAVFPATGGTIDALAANASITIPVAGMLIFYASSTTQWYSAANLQAAGGGVSLTAANNFTGSGAISVNGTGSIGYGTGAGGAVTQITSRTTGVTLNKITGAITCVNANPTAGTTAVFTVTNSMVAANDTVIVNIKSTSNTGQYLVGVDTVSAGSFNINLYATAADNSIPVIQFAVIKGAIA